MPRPVLTDAQNGYQGGLNTTADESQVGETELRRADNCRLTVFGSVTKRGGTQRTSSAALGSPSVVRGGSEWAPDGGSGVVQLAVANGTLYTGTYGVPMTWTAQTGAISSTAYPSFAAFRDASAEAMYVADGTLRKWNGTALTTSISGVPAGITQLAVQNRRLFGINGVDETLYYSDLDNGDSLGNASASGGQEFIRTFAKRANKALLALSDSLLIFHASGISVFTGWSQDDIAINSGTRGLSADTGTIAPRSVIAVENVGYYLTDRGFYEVTTAGVRPISQQIESVIRSLDHSQFARVTVAHSRTTAEVLWYLPDIGVYAFNYRTNGWTGPWTGIYTSATVGALWSSVDATSTPIVLSGHNDGFVRRVDAPGVGVDDLHADGTGGTPIVMTARGKRFYAETPEHEKAWRWVMAQVDTGGSMTAALQWATETASGTFTLPFSASGRWGTAGATWGTGLWNSASSGSARAPLSGRGKFLDVVFVDDGQGVPNLSRLSCVGFDYGPNRY